jgi:hypothetical protein
MTEQNTRLGIMLMIATTFVFAMQDGISRHLAGEYNVFMVIMIRYWFLPPSSCPSRRAKLVGYARRQNLAARAAGVSRHSAGDRDLRDGAGLHHAGPD